MSSIFASSLTSQCYLRGYREGFLSLVLPAVSPALSSHSVNICWVNTWMNYPAQNLWGLFILPNEAPNLASHLFAPPCPTKADANLESSFFTYYFLWRSECQLFNSKNYSFGQNRSVSIAVYPLPFSLPVATGPALFPLVSLWVSRPSSLAPASSQIQSVLPSITRPQARTSKAWVLLLPSQTPSQGTAHHPRGAFRLSTLPRPHSSLRWFLSNRFSCCHQVGPFSSPP